MKGEVARDAASDAYPPAKVARSNDASEHLPAAMSLSPEVLELVGGWLPLSCLGALLATSRTTRAALDSQAAWQSRCKALWSGKALISPHISSLFLGGDPRGAVRASLEDARRNEITAEELCGTVWHCRAKRSAGKSWTKSDPWWQGRPPSQRRFVPSGEVLELRGASWEVSRVDGTVAYWRFANWIPIWGSKGQPEVRHVKPGERVKFHDFPSFLVWRHPLNWGFVLDSPWAILTSFQLPRRGARSGPASSEELKLASSLLDSKLQNSVQDARLEVDFYRHQIQVPERPPNPEHFFARDRGNGRVQFFIRDDNNDQEVRQQATGAAETEEQPVDEDIETDGWLELEDEGEEEESTSEEGESELETESNDEVGQAGGVPE